MLPYNPKQVSQGKRKMWSKQNVEFQPFQQWVFNRKKNIYIYEPNRNIKKKKEDKKKFHFFVKEESPLFNTTRQNRFVTKQMCNLYINVTAVEHDTEKEKLDGWGVWWR